MEHKKEANAGCLGLLGFGMTTALLNLHNIGAIEMSMMIIAMGICLGGLAQFIAGLMEFKAGNTFGATAFTAYGLFWWSLVLIFIIPAEKWQVAAADGKALGWYFIFWCIFTFFMFLGTLKGSKALMLVFLTLTLLFLFLAIEKFTGSETICLVAGIIGIICGCIAIYTAVANVLNETYGKKVFPV